MSDAPAYPNLLSRWLLADEFRDQWVIREPPRLAEALFLLQERLFLRVDLAGIAVDRPIFILSLPRCGSSMLQDLLCTHPQVGYTTNMMDTFRRCPCAAERFRRRAHLEVRGERFLADSVDVGAGSPADPVGTWAEWLKIDPFSLDCREPSVAEFSPAERERIRDGIRRVLWCFDGAATRYECKTPALLPYARVLRDLFPDAKFVHLVRDARPAANSLLKLNRLCREQLERIRPRVPRFARETRPFVAYPYLPGLPGYLARYGADDIRTTAHLWSESVRYIERIRGELPHFLEVRYEDILAAPEREIARIAEFCELAPFGRENAAFRERIAGVGHVHHRNAYGSYEVVESICRKEMRRYGYL